MDLDILAFGAHPDDTELGCSGTIASLINSGKRVGVVDLTRGEMGSRGSASLRMEESQIAAEILGLSARENLGLPDTELVNNRVFQLSIIQKIRKFRPHICLIPAPVDRHPDHGNASELLQDAIFYSGLIKIVTKSDDDTIQNPHRPAHVLKYMLDTPFEPDFIFDITSTIEKKESAIKAFSSQFDVADPGNEPETYISDPRFFESLRAKAKYYGQRGGFDYGEPFLYGQKPFSLSSFDFLMDSSPKR